MKSPPLDAVLLVVGCIFLIGVFFYVLVGGAL